MLRLVTGGSCSGKSAFAEKLAIEEKKKHPAGTLYYVATMVPYDEECQERIRRHRRMRKDKAFVTRECHTCLLYTSVFEALQPIRLPWCCFYHQDWQKR